MIISIKPQYADKIVRGEKHWEFRRKPIRDWESSHVFLYSSATKGRKVSAIIANFIFVDFWFQTPEILLERISREKAGSPGITLAALEQYARGNGLGLYAYRVAKVYPAERHLPLHELRKLLPGFHAPQTHRKTTLDERMLLLKHGWPSLKLTD